MQNAPFEKTKPSKPSSVTRPEEPASVEEWRDPVTGMAFVWVPGGCFQMGSNEGQSDEMPVHKVCVDGFWMGKYEVTIGQYLKFVTDTRKYHPEWMDPGSENNLDRRGDGKQKKNHPVMGVSWKDATAFAAWLSKNTGKTIRLPTEAQWEYACRSGGKQEKYCGGNNVKRVAWYRDNSRRKTHPVGKKASNGLGLHDMSGNVWEWVGDWYDEGYYGTRPRNNPKGPSKGFYRVFRGGSWFSETGICRSTVRGMNAPVYRIRDLGFRLARNKP